MRYKTNIKPAGAMLVIALLSGGITGCVEEAKLNTETVSYTPEERPLGVIAGEGAQYSIESGSSISLTGRLVGTVTGQTILWSQLSGTAVEGVADWTASDLTFDMPAIDGIESFRFSNRST